MKQPIKIHNLLVKVLWYATILILVAMPFHALFTTFIGTSFGGLLLWKAWKDILLFFLLLLALVVVGRNTELRNTMMKKRVWQGIALFVAWQIIALLLGVFDADAMLSGFVMQVRLFSIFFVAYVAALHQQTAKENLFWYKIILIPSTIVALFALLQVTLLPAEFLTVFGYHKELSIPPYFTIDNQIDHLRAFSTTRGPNMLGAYLIVPISALLVLMQRLFVQKRYRYGGIAVLLLILHVAALYVSHSRGAWVGMLAAGGVYILLSVPKKVRNLSLLTGCILVVFSAIGLYSQRSSSFVQNVILHDNPEAGGVRNSNEERFGALTDGVVSLKEDPLTGCGAGCAGPASVRHEAGAKIAENHYIQTAQESGVIGLLLLFLVFYLVLRWLWQYRAEPLAVMLITSFVGISVASLFSHVWADDLLSYLWWGVAGLWLGMKDKKQ